MKIPFMQLLTGRLPFGTEKGVVGVIRLDRRSPLWTMMGGIIVSTILFWVMVQLGQASPEPKHKVPLVPALTQGALPIGSESTSLEIESQNGVSGMGPPMVQGPAVDVPREVLELLERRKRELDRREERVRQQEGRLLLVKGEVEKLLEKNEALEKRLQTTQAQKAQQVTQQQSTQRAKVLGEKERVAQEQRTQLAKIYEAMPSEDAAARLERMPDRKAIEILRMVKSKTAGAILAQVKADRAAKLTEQLLLQNQ